MTKYFTLLVGPAIFLVGLILAAPAQAEADMGDLVKCPDYTAVYYVGDDGGRYTFPNENTYKTWYKDFDDVKHISCDDLAELPLEGNVPYQAGTDLIKIQSDPTVYAVEPEGELRPLTSEDQAQNLYGDDWADKIDDIPDGFFNSYEIGEPLEEDKMPEGYLLKDEEADELYRVDDEGQVEQIDFVLDEEQKEFYDNYANDLDTVQSELDTEFSLIKEEVLALLGDYETDVMELMKTVMVSEENKVTELDITLEEMSPELVDLLTKLSQLQDNTSDSYDQGEKDWDDDIIRVKEFLSDVQIDVDQAVDQLHEEEWSDKDISGAKDLAYQAVDLLEQAWGILPDGEYVLAEEYGVKAQELADRVLSGEGVE